MPKYKLATSKIKSSQTVTSYYTDTIARRTGNVVTLRINVNSNKNYNVNAWNTICTIDEIYRPSENADALIQNNSASSVGEQACTIRVEASGNVLVWPYISNARPCGVITYCV